MSTTQPANGVNGTSQTGGSSSSNARPPPKRVVRKRPTTDIFNTARDSIKANGHTQPVQQNGHANVVPKNLPRPHTARKSPSPSLSMTDETTGFTDKEVLAGRKHFQDFKLVTTKRELLDGLRYHLLEMAPKQPLDIRNAKSFTPPVHLHRRDPRAAATTVKIEEPVGPKDDLNVEQREELNRRKEARKIEREQNLAQIAPTQAARKAAAVKLRTKQVYKADYSEADKRRIQTNYEEKLPWHLEDFDGKQILVGENQPASSHIHAAFVFEPSTNRFRYLPVEKVYKFAPKKKEVPTLTLEEAMRNQAKQEAANNTKWLEGVYDKSDLRKKHQREQEQARKLYSGANRDSKGAGRTGEEADQDFSAEELFADDEEGDIFAVKDEDEKLAEKRIKEDQLKANYFDVKDEREYDQEEQEETLEDKKRRLGSRKIKRALEKFEHDFNHGSDSEYSSSEEEEEEVEEEERARLEAERNANLQNADGSKPVPSGANTPSNRAEKRPLSSALLSDREGPSRKRPGSPNLSDASGTDASSRAKKPKTKHLSILSGQPQPSSSATIPRSDSPSSIPSSSAPRIKIRGPVSGAGSDTDAAMSDRSRVKKLKNKNRDGTPLTSRPGSPDVPSRPGSTAPQVMPSADDIREVIRKAEATGGLDVQMLISRVPHPHGKQLDFINLVKSVARVQEVNGKKILVLR